MNLFAVAATFLKESLRNKSALLYMVLSPIVLLTILSLALSGDFYQEAQSMEEFRLELSYSIEEGYGSALVEAYVKGFEASPQVRVTRTPTLEEGKSRITGYVSDYHLHFGEHGLTEYLVDLPRMKSGVLMGINGLVQESIRLGQPLSMETAAPLVGINQRNAIPMTSVDYYSVVVLTMIMTYGVIYAIYSIKEEKDNMTYFRIIASPVTTTDYFFGKLLANVTLVLLYMVPVLLYGQLVLRANWQNSLAFTLLLLLSYSIMISAFGMAIGTLVKNTEFADNILQRVFIPIMAFLGGSYVNLENFANPILERLSLISPIRWVNTAIFNHMYYGTSTRALVTLSVNLVLTLLFIGLSLHAFRRGDEYGYN